MTAAVIGALRVDLGIDTAQFSKGLANARGELRKVGAQLSSIGAGISAGVTAPLVAAGATILRTAGDFQASMNRVGAVTGATGSQMDALRATAKELGRTTQFSASQAADAMGFLGMAGFDANQIIGAMPGTLQLAAAAQMDLASAADIVSNVLSGYSMEVDDLGRVNDVLVKTFTRTNTDLRQLGEAMKYVGPIATAAGVQFEETAAAVGLMGNAGIQASMAGTSLRGAISRILTPTANVSSAMEDAGLSFVDAQGKLIGLDEIIRQLEPHADNAGLFMTLFGQRAGPAMAALVSQGSDALTGLTKELENAGGTAGRIAEAQMQGFEGSMKQLRSALEGLAIAIADSGLLEFVTKVVEGLTGIAAALAETNPQLLQWGTVTAAVAAAAGPLVLTLGGLALIFGTMAAPIVLAVGAIALAVGWFVAYRDEIAAVVTALREDFWGTMSQVWDWVVEKVSSALQSIGASMVRVRDWYVETVNSMFDRAVAAVGQFVGDFINGFAELPGLMFEAGKDILRGLLNGLKEMGGEVVDWVYGLGSRIVNAVTEPLGIQSPSTVMHGLGVNIMEGLRNGMVAGQADVTAVAQDTAAKVDAALRLAGMGEADPWAEFRISTDKAGQSLQGLGGVGQGVASQLSSAIKGLLDGSKDLGEVLKGLLSQLTDMALNQGLQLLLGGLFGGATGGAGGGLGGLFNGLLGFANGGSFKIAGGSNKLDDQVVAFRASAGETVSVGREAGGGMMGGAVSITVNVEGANGDAQVMKMVSQGVREGISRYDQEMQGPKLISRIQEARFEQ